MDKKQMKIIIKNLPLNQLFEIRISHLIFYIKYVSILIILYIYCIFIKIQKNNNYIKFDIKIYVILFILTFFKDQIKIKNLQYSIKNIIILIYIPVYRPIYTFYIKV